MFKDVWKRFGAKALIVLCSVLLLGGVAIAAPQLRAQGERELDFIEATELQSWINTGSAIQITYTKSGSAPTYSINADGSGQQITPDRIEVVNSGIGAKVTLSAADFTVSNGSELTKAGTNLTLKIRRTNNSNKLRGQTEVVFKDYTINKCPSDNYSTEYVMKNALSYTDKAETDWLVTNSGQDIQAGDMDLYVRYNGGNRIPVQTGDYAIQETTAGDKKLGSRQFQIELFNFSDNGNTWIIGENKCDAVKDIADQTISVDSAGITQENYSSAVTITDRVNATPLSRNTHYTLGRKEETIEGGQKYTLTITGRKGGGYVGTWTKDYTVGQRGIEVVTESDKALDYNAEGNDSFKFTPNLIVRPKDGGTEEILTGGANGLGTDVPQDYTVEGYQIGKLSGSEVFEPIEGATAGTVAMNIKITKLGSAFQGREATVYYQVKRNIEDAIVENPSGYNFVYNTLSYHSQMIPQIYFSDADGKKYLSSDDFKVVSYDLSKKRGTSYLSQLINSTNSAIDAGRVYLNIEGNLKNPENSSTGGYYGTLSSYDHGAYYEIAPFKIADLNAALQLKESVYEQNGSKPSIEATITVGNSEYQVHHSNINNKILKGNAGEKTEYNIKFYRDENCTDEIGERDWAQLPPGTYYVQYNFIGNYDGSLSAEFRIREYKIDDVHIRFVPGTCSAGCTIDQNGKGHVYNGEEHEPKFVVEVEEDGEIKEIESYAYEKPVYSNNKNAGDATVSVTLKGSGEASTRTTSTTFEIDPLSLDNSDPNSESIELLLPYSNGKHDYSGKTNKPELKSLVYSSSKVVGLNLYAEKPDSDTSTEVYPYPDFVVGDIWVSADGSTGWRKLNYPLSTALDMNAWYRFDVTGNNNCTGKGYTSTFQFQQRDISNATGKDDLAPMENANANTSLDVIQTYIEKIVLKDLGDTLTFGTDFTITINKTLHDDPTDPACQDFRKTNGTVKFTINGMGAYTGSVEGVLRIGKDITKAKVIEKDALDIIPGSSPNGMPFGSVKLVGPYATAKDEPDGVKFKKTEAETGGLFLTYKSGSSFTSDTLYNGTEYKVTYDIVEARPEDPMDKNSPLYGVITLTGINGYYGTIEVKVPVEKIKFKDGAYEIQFAHTDAYDGDSTHTGNIYTGEELEPEFRVVLVSDPDDSTKWLKLGNDYEVVTNGWHYNINASEGRGSYGEQPYVEIKGIGHYEGTLVGKFTIYKRDIGKTATGDDGNDHLVINDRFTTEGWRNPVHTYTYTPFTKTDGKESKGVLPQVTLLFDGKELTMGTDYRRSYVNEINACRFDDVGVTYDQLPKVYFDADTVNSRNFKGKFYETYEIQPITLSDEKQCEVSLVPERKAFTGNPVKPDVSVKILRDDGTTYDMRNEESEGKDKDYKFVYNQNGSDTFISVDQTSALRAYVSVEEAASKNFEGKIPLNYVIYGQFQPESAGGKKNSLMVVEGDKVDYNPASRVGGCKVIFYEKLDEVEGTLPDVYETVGDESKARRHVLKENGEYVVNVPNRIGIQEAVITPNVNYFEGSAKCNITIKGDLDASYIHYTFTRPVTYPVGGKDFHLEDFLKVTYDGENGQQIPLVFGVDYEFASEPTINIGENFVNIQPIEGKSDAWLTGTKEITYNLTADLGGATLVDVKKEYPYAHGMPVIKPEEIKVSLDGVVLNKNDYTIEIEGDAINVGTHKIIVKGSGTKFSGTFEWPFNIVPYNLENAVAEGIITVNYPEEVVYTGSKVWPSVKSIRISSHLLWDGKTEDESGALVDAEYETDIASETGVDYVNWTRDPENRPKFIVRGKGNYTGEISYPYSITRKDIGDEENVILDAEALKDIYYNNGKDIAPIPILRYNKRDLTGIQYDSNHTDQYKDWQDYAIHFTYQHKGDLKRVGTKSIVVRGIGNFRGERTITYEVKPLNIADTELVFTGDTPVYNGNKQQPAFNLIYGDVILQYNGNKVISDNITDVTVKFDNNINATKEGKLATVTVSIPEDAADNYFGTKEATFSIQPAPLTGHTKFMYHPGGENAVQDLSSYRLNLPFEGVGTSVIPQHPKSEEELGAKTVGVYYQFPQDRRVFMIAGSEGDGDHDYEISYQYVEPDTDDVEIRDGFGDAPTCSYAGKVKVTITGVGNYTDSVNYWYFIGKDIASEANIRINPTTAVYNSQVQAPAVTITGVDKEMCTIGKYKGKVAVENLITDKGFVNADDYYIRVEGDPTKGTYSTEPQTLKYTITARPISSGVVIDGYKKEYAYTGFEICPVGISVTDYIDKVKYKLTEDVDYTLSYTNNLNAGTATIHVNGQNNFSGTATAKFLITSSTITSGGSDTNSPFNPGTGEISGATAIKPDDVKLTMDTSDAMYYTGSQLFPKVSIAGMTENIDYTVTYSNNIEVGIGTIYISGIGNNNGMITRNFNIIAQLSKCTVAPIPAQRYTGSAITPTVTVTCGTNILVEGTDYIVSYANNTNIGTATVTIRSANNPNYLGSTSAKFSISNDVGGFIISGYAPSYVYTGSAITPAIVVETGSAALTQGTDYTVSYSNNVDAGMATITVTGIGRYSGTQTANFIIEPKSIQSLAASAVEDKTYTGDAYTPSITISDGDKVLTNGVDYTITYTNNTAPGLATAVITGTSNNYTGTKIVSFKISGVAVTGFKASSVTYKSLKLSWTKQDYADGYQICDSQSKGIKSTTKNSVSITGLKGGKTYKYKIRSFIRNADGTRSYGAFSSVISVTTKLKTPTVKITSTKKGQAKLSWSKVSGATGYEIYYKSSAKAKYRKLKTINKANTRICTVKGMKSKSRAYFRVRAFKKSGSKKIYSALNPLKVITIK